MSTALASTPAKKVVAQPAPPAKVEAPTPAPEAAPAPARAVFYDLLAHRDHAELRLGQTLILDFGLPGEAKYTLGGWGTRMLPGAAVAGARAALVKGSYGDVTLPVQFAGAGVLTIRARAPRDGDLTVYLDDEVLTRVKQDRASFATLRLPLDEKKLGRREHMLRLRGSGMASVDGVESAVLLDWVAIGPEGAPTPPEQAHALGAGSEPLTIPDGVTVSYTLRVPAGARFSADIKGASDAQLALSAVGDDLVAQELGAARGGSTFALDLEAFAGRVVRLDLTARGAVSLDAAKITLAPLPVSVAEKPVHNVLLYLVDTLRADHLKPFNPQTRVVTPGLDGLVELGARVFTSAHTQENWTKPSVATLLSSLMPWEHNAVTTEAVVPKSVALLPEVLGQRGFYTGAFIANGYVSDKFGFNQGWSTYRNYIREGRYSRAEFLAADAVEWLDQRPKDQPFFLYVHAIDPHVPYKPTSEFLSLYDPLPYQGVVDFSGDSTLLEKIKIGDIRLAARDKVHLEALYDSEISYHDVHFRSLLGALDKRGLGDDTMIIVVADHGEEFWDHGSVGHGHSVYEELLHIPMVVRVPGLTQGAVRVDSAVGLVDVMPTVLEVLGQPLPEGLSGRSLLPELKGQTLDAPAPTVSGFMEGWRTALLAGLKLIQRTEKRVMLYDLAADPHEQRDLAVERPISTRYLRGQLGLALAKSQPQADARSGKRGHAVEKTAIDADTEAQLRALGYVGSSRR